MDVEHRVKSASHFKLQLTERNMAASEPIKQSQFLIAQKHIDTVFYTLSFDLPCGKNAQIAKINIENLEFIF